MEDGVKLADMLIFQNINKLNVSEISEFKKRSFSYLIFFVLISCLIISIWNYYIYTKRLKELNIFGFEYNGYFIDIGIPEDYKKAQDDFKGFKYR